METLQKWTLSCSPWTKIWTEHWLHGISSRALVKQMRHPTYVRQLLQPITDNLVAAHYSYCTSQTHSMPLTIASTQTDPLLWPAAEFTAMGTPPSQSRDCCIANVKHPRFRKRFSRSKTTATIRCRYLQLPSRPSPSTVSMAWQLQLWLVRHATDFCRFQSSLDKTTQICCIYKK